MKVLKFWASWCGPCKMIEPILKSVCEEKNVELVPVSCENSSVEEAELIKKYNVSSIPLVVLVEDGKEPVKLLGALPKARYEKEIEKFQTQHGLPT